MTTHDQGAASVMFASAIHHIVELPKDDSWSLFAKYAFHSGNSDECLKLEALGR
jgi:hypothetical protein